MVDLGVKVLIFCFTVSRVASDVCYSEDPSGSGFELSTVCPGACCTTGADPCCLDSGAIIAIIVGAVVTIFLLAFCAIVCYVERKHSRNYIMTRHRRMMRSMARDRAMDDNFLNFTEDEGEVDLPPRYSDLYPRNQTSTNLSGPRTSGRTISEGRRSTSSLGSLLRLSFGRNRTSGSSARNASSGINGNRNTNSAASRAPENNTENSHTHSEPPDTSLADNSGEPEKVKTTNDGHDGLMNSIAENLPSVLEDSPS